MAQKKSVLLGILFHPCMMIMLSKGQYAVKEFAKSLINPFGLS